MLIHSARNTKRVSFFGIPGKAAGRDPESKSNLMTLVHRRPKPLMLSVAQRAKSKHA
jgi:hypothetical protein